MLSRWCKVLSFYSRLVVVAKYVIFSYFQIHAAAAHHVSASTKLLSKNMFFPISTVKNYRKNVKIIKI